MKDSFILVELDAGRSRNEISNLLDAAFNVPDNQHYLEDFPVWDPRFNVKNSRCYGIQQAETLRLVATCSIRIVELKIPVEQGFSVKVAILGAVSTYPEFRKLGLATKLINQSILWAQGAGASAVFLWSSQNSFYQNLGFHFYGSQIRAPLTDLNFPEVASVADIFQGWHEGIFDLITARNEGLTYSKSDLDWFRSHSHVEWFYTMKGQSVSAYAAIGRGIDLDGHMHEWGGDLLSILTIIKYIKFTRKGVILLASPDHFKKFGFDLSLGVLEPLCFVKLLKSHDTQRKFDLSLPVWFWGLDAA